MSLGLWSAFAASLCYGLASVLQSVGARAALPVTVRSDGSRSPHPGGSTHLRDIARQPLFVTGLLFDGAGFALSLSALRTLPLYTAEAVLAASVGVTAIGAAAVLRQPMVPLEIGSIVLLIVGLAALGSTAGRTSVAPLSDAGSIALLASSVVLAGLLVVVPSTPAGSARALAAMPVCASAGWVSPSAHFGGRVTGGS